ncbi:MAG: LapA family protein [Patescibacteria group bacterium]
MLILFILGLLLGAVAVIFALQNITPVTATFFMWQLEGSMAMLLLLAVMAGVVITLLLFLPGGISNYFRYRRVVKENERIREELRKQKELTVFAKTPPPTDEALERIENGM